MKKYFYSLLATGGLLLFAPSHASATLHRCALTENPTETQRKTVAAEKAAAKTARKTSSRTARKAKAKLRHAFLVVLGMEEAKTVTSPRQLRRQLHGHQKQLKMHARMEARSRRARVHE